MLKYISFKVRILPGALSFPRATLIFIHKSVQESHFDMDAGMTNSDVGRNKPARRQQGWAFPALLSLGGMPEAPVLRLMRGQAYSGLLLHSHAARWNPDALVPTRCVGTHQGRAASCNATAKLYRYSCPHTAQRADTAFPRSALERGKLSLKRLF